MQTSNKTSGAKRFGQFAAKTGMFLAAVLLTNAALSFLVEPYMGSSKEMWTHYHEQTELDTIYVGTSQCLSAFDPSVIDAKLGTHSYNMATNMQSPTDTYDAIETAIEDHGIRRAVVVLDHEILMTDRYDNFRAEASYWHAKGSVTGIGDDLKDGISFVTDPAFRGKPISLTYFAPWIYNRSTNIRLNVQEKLAGEIQDGADHRTSQGYEPSSQNLDENLPRFTGLEDAGAWDAWNPDLVVPYITDANAEEFRRIARLCKANGTELIAVVVPYPNWLDIYNAKGYMGLATSLDSMFREEGASFYDFNLVKEEHYERDRSYFKDVGHMNSTGSEIFSGVFADFLAAKDSGEDVGSWFYDPQAVDLSNKHNSKRDTE